MSEQENVRKVQEIYAAFGRGDIPAILDAVAENVEWHHTGAPEVPYGKTRHGRQGAAQFFTELSDHIEVLEFEPREYVSDGETVIALGSWGGRAKRTGRSFRAEWAMVWKFSGGKVVYYRAYENTAAVAAACLLRNSSSQSSTSPEAIF